MLSGDNFGLSNGDPQLKQRKCCGEKLYTSLRQGTQFWAKPSSRNNFCKEREPAPPFKKEIFFLCTSSDRCPICKVQRWSVLLRQSRRLGESQLGKSDKILSV